MKNRNLFQIIQARTASAGSSGHSRPGTCRVGARMVGRRTRRGFTLMELMVVMLILAILAALILPRLFNKASDAKVAKAKTDISTLDGLVGQYRLDTDHYPTSEDGLNALRVKPNGVNNWKGPYSQHPIPADPWGNEYVYQSPGPNGEDYTIMSYGADGAPGGDGDDADISMDK